MVNTYDSGFCNIPYKQIHLILFCTMFGGQLSLQDHYCGKVAFHITLVLSVNIKTIDS